MSKSTLTRRLCRCSEARSNQSLSHALSTRVFPGIGLPKHLTFQRQLAPTNVYKKSSCNPYRRSRVLIHTESIDIQTSQNMKAILIETTLVSAALLFWTVALPATVVLLPAVALWEKIGALIPRGPIGPVRPENPQDPARIPLEQAWRADVRPRLTPASS